MKRLLILSNKVPFPPRDGSSIAMASLIRGLRTNGMELTVLALNTAKHRIDKMPDEALNSGIEWHVPKVNTSPNLSGAITNLFSSKSYMASRFDLPQVRKITEKILANSDRFSAAIVDGLFMMPYAEVIQKAGIPIILRAHNVEHQIWKGLIKRKSNPVKSKYLKLQAKRLEKFERDCIRKVDAILPISEGDTAWFRQVAGNKTVYTLPAGIREADYPFLGSAIDDVYCIGSMDWLPNINGMQWFVRKVWPLILKKNSEVTFNLAGRNARSNGFHRPESGLFAHGEIPSAREFSARHGILAIPLHAGSGIRIKLLEGMSYGKAIVTTSVGAEGMPFQSGVHGIIADTAIDFAEAIVYLLQNPEKRNSMGEAARATALKYFDETQTVRTMLDELKLT